MTVDGSAIVRIVTRAHDTAQNTSQGYIVTIATDAAPYRRHCPQCDSRRLVGTGIGTQQTEAFLSERFSAYPVIRVDSDTMQDRESMANLIEELSNAEPVH